MEFIIIVLAVILAVAAEIKFDKFRWKNLKSDKHISTILRVVFLVGLAFTVHKIFGSSFWIDLLVVTGIHTMLFDQCLNISRWKVLSQIKNLSYNYKIAHGIHMTRIEKILWSMKKFNDKLFYHGLNPKPWTWDYLFMRIPPAGELLFKSALLLSGIMLYFELY